MRFIASTAPNGSSRGRSLKLPSLARQGHSLQHLVRHPREPTVVHGRVRLLRLVLLQQPVPVLDEDLVEVAEGHGSGHLGRHARSAVQRAVVVRHDGGTLRPMEVLDEAIVLAQLSPHLVGLHEVLIDIEGQSANTTLRLGLNDLLNMALIVELDDRVGLHQLERCRRRRVVVDTARGTLFRVQRVARAVGHLDLRQELVSLGVMLLDILRECQAVADLRTNRALSLVQELQEPRGALVHGVIRVHGQRVGHVVVRALLRTVGGLAHHAKSRRTHRMLVELANEFVHKVLDGLARKLPLQALGRADAFDQADARADHGLQEFDLLLLTLYQGRGIESGHLDVVHPRLAPLVQVLEQGARALDLRSTGGKAVQSLAHKRCESMKPLRLEDISVPGAGRRLVDHLELATALEGRDLTDGVVPQLPHIRRRGPVEVRPLVAGVRVLQPRGMDLVPGPVRKLELHLLASIDRGAGDQADGRRGGGGRLLPLHGSLSEHSWREWHRRPRRRGDRDVLQVALLSGRRRFRRRLLRLDVLQIASQRRGGTSAQGEPPLRHQGLSLLADDHSSHRDPEKTERLSQ
mmetsp:Transcript_157203/g.504339  ORF Transcript_157203/g.504339 Transcript_157203/m.504339 type:complete len:577 (+) Transcript_157203:66-1796(+)